MVRTLSFQDKMTATATATLPAAAPAGCLSGVGCEHRTVSRDGRIVCKKIVEGNAEVSPNVCRECPFKAINCAHLRFSLRLTSPSPLVVRFNGRTELWDDGPAELRFDHAACAARVAPIHSPQACAGCALRSERSQVAPGWQGLPPAEPARPAAALAEGRVVAFPGREALAAAG